MAKGVPAMLSSLSWPPLYTHPSRYQTRQRAIKKYSKARPKTDKKQPKTARLNEKKKSYKQKTINNKKSSKLSFAWGLS